MDTALLVLDIQKDFTSEQARMSIAKHQIDPMLKCVNTIINKANSINIPIVYIGNEFERKQFITNFFRKNSALKGSNGAKLDDRLIRVNNIYFSKNKADAFSNSELISYLNTNGIKDIIIVGLFAEGCVTATAYGAIRRNFTSTVVRDAVGSSNDKKRLNSLNKMGSNGVTIIDSSQLLEQFN